MKQDFDVAVDSKSEFKKKVKPGNQYCSDEMNKCRVFKYLGNLPNGALLRGIDATPDCEAIGEEPGQNQQ